MAFSGNTVPYKTEWIKAYQETHYKQPVFPVFAEQKFFDVLVQGSTIKWSYDDDSDVQDLGTDGSYTVANKTVTDETLTVDEMPTSTFRIPAPQRIQDHRPTQAKWAQKAMNRIFWKMDAQMLGAMKSAAASTVDSSDPLLGSGTSGVPITVNTSNVGNVFAAARLKLRNQNVIYDENKKWTGIVKLDATDKYAVAAIPPELEAQYLLSVGFKPGDLGDQVLTRGFLNRIFGFNTFVSTSLPYTFRLTFSATPTDGSTLTIGGVVFTWETGTITDQAGKVKAETDATTSVGNLVRGLNSIYTSVSGDYQALVRADLTQAQRFVADMISAVDNGDGSCDITVLGNGTQTVSQTDAAGTISRNAVHAIFGTSQSIALVMQRAPELQVSGDIIGNGSTGGYVAKDFVTWTLAGWKVFNTMSKQLVDVSISTTGFSNPSNVYN